ncbi:hypothetical protein, partial [Rubripirellula obstinata]|uniref:hypothetical protein n=1 Tax=Rubripirellula obstinata TaxID=406547 RepID=UPI001EE44033
MNYSGNVDLEARLDSATQSDNDRDHRVRREKSTITENLASRTPVHPMVIRDHVYVGDRDR